MGVIPAPPAKCGQFSGAKQHRETRLSALRRKGGDIFPALESVREKVRYLSPNRNWMMLPSFNVTWKTYVRFVTLTGEALVLML